MEDRKHYWEDVCIPRNEFIKEHVKLLKLLRHGDRTQLLAEAKDQEAELKRETRKGGSRAAGYIKKLIAMYKDGLEVFDIKKMKWASDNLKAFGISMEEDEGPVGADDYSEYSPKEASIRKKIDALAKKADKEGNTAEIKAEYKQLRTELKAEEPKKRGVVFFDKEKYDRQLEENMRKIKEAQDLNTAHIGKEYDYSSKYQAPPLSNPLEDIVTRLNKSKGEDNYGDILDEYFDFMAKHHGVFDQTAASEMLFTLKQQFQAKNAKKKAEEPEKVEKPAEAVNVIEQVTEDAEEKDVGKFSYNKDFFGAIDKMYTIQRNRASVRGKVVDAKLFDSIVSIQNNYDLYPTPLKSLLPIFEDIVKLEGRYTTPLSFLEPSAGTGNIVRSMIDFGNVKKIKQIDAVEMSQDLAKLLQDQTTISNVYRQDFLTFEPKTDYHYIIMNPPYSDGNNKTFWLEHLMKAMSIAWNQTRDGGGLQCAIYIIIPTTYMENMFKEAYPNGYGAAKKYIGEEIQFDMNLCNKKKELVKKYGFYDDEDDDWDPTFWLKKVGIIDDFAKIERNGTARPLNIATGIYRLVEGQMGGSKKKRSTHNNTY